MNAYRLHAFLPFTRRSHRVRTRPSTTMTLSMVDGHSGSACDFFPDFGLAVLWLLFSFLLLSNKKASKTAITCVADSPSQSRIRSVHFLSFRPKHNPHVVRIRRNLRAVLLSVCGAQRDIKLACLLPSLAKGSRQCPFAEPVYLRCADPVCLEQLWI